MSPLRSTHALVLLLAISLAACADSRGSTDPDARDPSALRPSATLSSGSASTLLGRANFAEADDQTFDVKRITGDWHFQIKAKPAFDIAVQSITFAPNGGNSGWHQHPGPVFIQVTSGTLTFYESDDPTCTPVRRNKGEGFLDVGDHAHYARNETASPAQTLVTYFAPPGAALRIDAPLPGNCPF